MRPDEISFLTTMSHFGAIFFALALMEIVCIFSGQFFYCVNSFCREAGIFVPFSISLIVF